MIQTIYSIILIYFILGGIGFYLINRKRDKETARKSYTKYFTYFFIIHILFFGIIIDPLVFRIISVVIVLTGLVEVIKLFAKKEFNHKFFFYTSFLVYLLVSAAFIRFGLLNKELILFSFLILSIFDSFSQITGQLWGKRKILPEVSPNKTLGGLVGGAGVALISAFLLRTLFDGTIIQLYIVSVGVLFFAFWGDIGASFYKRRFEVKDFSNLIPGHGGFLDRFDSLIAGGAWVALFMLIAG
ncbi:phosphatidate cytidylyltransferase [Alkalitalea saponilacus]|uniref:Phosphatidate cytidylyltransferase n=1 Tax=Alkalitalea saponilacus TaxID=889453 RepID=A0A1T5HTM0_9BACT|nr:phosphatidate cytidylyltransferase [Alkalitalea saponilacus]ASB49956.1 phosphatidate cytidylyltransferase [Alkalitalea saponilacus]SKC24026.1 phosphatidate cytidylyltransferase [Alkalitalea saponilacus]